MQTATERIDVRCPFDLTGLVRADDVRLWYAGWPETYAAVLSATVERRGDAVAVIGGSGTTLTYAELWDRARGIAGGLRAAGVAPGDRVALDLPNSLEWVVSFLGTLLAGAVAV